MKTKSFFFLFCFIIVLIHGSNCFSKSRNVIKVALAPLILKNYSLYFERAIHKNVSFSIGGSYMPTRGLPSFITNYANDTTGTLSNISFSGLSIVPELRIYPGAKIRHEAPHGFYFTLYVKYSSYKADFPFTYKESGNTYTYNFSGNYTGIGAGIMLGHQWIIGEHFSIDWWLSGAHFGNLYSTFTMTNSSLSSINQPQFIKDIGNISFPQGEVNTEISGNTAKLTIDAPFIGFRSGFTLGIAF